MQMLTDPENVLDYLALPLMDRITNLMSFSLRDTIEKATEDVDHVLCVLVTQNEEGILEVIIPQDRWDCVHLETEHSACDEEEIEYINVEVTQTILQAGKSGDGTEVLEPFQTLSFLATIDNKKVYWLPVAKEAAAPHKSNELFIRICDEFGKRWGDFLSTTDLTKCNEYWDETSRRVLGVPSAFIEYCTGLLLSDYFHLDDYENDGISMLVYLNVLSSQPYEGRPCKGTICFLKRNLQEYTLLMKFEKEEFLLERPLRENRKLLEMTDEQRALIIEEGYIVGIGDVDLGDERITFYGNGRWSFETPDKKTLFKCESGKIQITSDVDSSNIQWRIEEQFGESCDVQVLMKIIRAASEQKHGTGIVITNDAENEANRLFEAGRDIMIKPLFLGNHIDAILPMTKIDGAIILDPYGTCYAVGAIVDGVAVITGSTARGARYNSLSNYVAWQQTEEAKCVAIIISEDGTVEAALTRDETNDRWIGNG